MAFTYLQGKGVSAGSALSISGTFTNSLTEGSFFVVQAMFFNASTENREVTFQDNSGNNFALVPIHNPKDSNVGSIYQGYLQSAPNRGTTITATFPVSFEAAGLWIAEFKADRNPINLKSYGWATGLTGIQGNTDLPSLTLDTTGQLVIYGESHNGLFSGVVSPWTQIAQPNSDTMCYVLTGSGVMKPNVQYNSSSVNFGGLMSSFTEYIPSLPNVLIVGSSQIYVSQGKVGLFSIPLR